MIKKAYNYEKIEPVADFVGRRFELERLKGVLEQKDSNITIVYGRRRVGKSELLERALVGRKVFKFEGLEQQSVSAQRRVVLEKLATYTSNLSIAKLKLGSWREVFLEIAKAVEGLEGIVLYFEELQWLANYRSDLVSDLKYVWDNHFRKIPGLKVILCGSATSFMIRKVVRSRALYSRSTYELPLESLTVSEVGKYLPQYSAQHLLEAYLLLGGIPGYLRYLKASSTPLTTLWEEAFVPGGYFLSEFDRIFTSSLAKYRIHKEVIECFADRNFFSRDDLAKRVKVSPSGSFSQVLEDLALIGLLGTYKAQPSRLKIYFLRDPYLNLYLRIIKPKRSQIEEGVFTQNRLAALDHAALSHYLGYAFERFCRQNHFGIAKLLSIAGVEYSASPWHSKGEGMGGFQFDLVFDRKDRCLSLFEIKCKKNPLGLEVAKDFERKLELVKLPKGYSIQKVLISVGPVAKSLAETYYFNRIITLDEIVSL
jgi:AAA+ ATPase superfamily predicted ATPase